MSWMNYLGENELLYSDESLDNLHKFIKNLSCHYENSLDRKIKVEELRKLFELYLTTTTGDFFNDYNNKKITEVKFKINKIKKQNNIKIGDVFSILLNLMTPSHLDAFCIFHLSKI